MEINATKRGPRLTVQLIGELDHHSAERTRVVMDTMLHDVSVRELMMDLSGVTFMDSAGLGVILGRYRIIQLRGGRIMIKGASSQVDRIFEMSGLYALVERA